MSATVEYVYCVVPSALPWSDSPPGIDRAPVRLVTNADIGALVSSLDAAEYSGDVPAERMDDPQWLTPRALSHDALVTWAADRGAVVPFPMWVMFSDESAVSGMLAGKATQLRDALGRVSGAREFGVRITGDAESLAAAAEAMDSDIAVLQERAAAATPGQAYLLRRKLAETRKAATRDAAVRIATDAHDRLADHARSGVARATAVSREPGVILDGAYLVPDEQYDAFRTALTALMSTYEAAGLHFEFTGPWPPYHFVRGD